MSDDYQEKTAFDGGFSTVNRVNKLLHETNDAQKSNDVPLYYNAIKALYTELRPFLEKKNTKTGQPDLSMVEIHNELIQQVRKELGIYYEQVRFSQKNPNLPLKISMKVTDVLWAWDIQIRVHLKKVGLLMREGEDAREAMK